MALKIVDFLENVEKFLEEEGYSKQDSEYSWKLQLEQTISNRTVIVNGQVYQQPQVIPVSLEITYTGDGSICTVGEPEETLLQFRYKIQSGMQDPIEIEDCYYLEDFEVFKQIISFFTGKINV